MQLTDNGESRVRGYLFILERSLRTFLPAADALDASREVESHIRERIGETAAVPDERTALERVLGELGAPLSVARAYSLEMSAEEAIATGRIAAIARSLLHMAALGIGGFFAAIAIFVGYVVGLAFLVIAAMKPIFPDNVGLFVVDGMPLNFGAQFPRPEGAVIVGGYWVILVSATIGIAVLVLTHRLARRLIERWLRGRRNRILETKQRSQRG
ncbi:MAG TPA: hypothetical protein VNC21_05825 [Vicinamibacterales bacterium]|nr:hypothetical protein [Vicinamibacterales bacterium]